MKNSKLKKEYLLTGIVIFLFIILSYLSLTSIHQLSGNARVINYAGIVRGATQRLVKKELSGYPDDALINRLDSIVNELISGEGPNGLIVLPDPEYLSLLKRVSESWVSLKAEIEVVRMGGDKIPLFDLSENYFTLVDQTVSAAEQFSEAQVTRSTNFMIVVTFIFVALMLAGLISIYRTSLLKKKAEDLGRIAYLDPLTQMPNRASCEQEISRLKELSSADMIAVFMFDMNNLKLVNDQLGHQGGDRIIADFARIIKTEAAPYGFIGRYGGDEFLGLFENGNETLVQEFLAHVNEKIVAYNLLHIKKLEKLSFAVGYVIDSIRNRDLDVMINDADHRMYTRKRQMKENKED